MTSELSSRQFRRLLARRSQLDLNGLLRALPDECQRDHIAGPLRANHALQRRDVIDVVAVGVDDDVTLLNARVSGWARALLRVVSDERAANLGNTALCELVGLRVLLRNLGELQAEDAATDVAVLHDLVHHVAYERHGNRETIAGVTASRTRDRRVHADDFTADVDEWSTRVAGVDRRVGLEVVDDCVRGVIESGEPASLRADDALRDREIETERIPDGQHPVTDACRLVVAEGNGRKVFAIDLYDGDVGRRIASNDLRVELAPVGENDSDLVGVGDDVVVGENNAVGRDDEARARSSDGLILTLPATTATAEGRAAH